MTERPQKYSGDIKKIAELLEAAKAAELLEIEAEIPYYSTSNSYGKFTVKAKWRR